MCLSICSVLIFWATYWVAAILPNQIAVPMLLPALVLVLVVAATQAGSWMIRTRPGVGCLLSLLAIGGPIFSVVAYVNGVPLGISTMVTAVLIAGSVWLSLENAPLARHSIGNIRTVENAAKWAERDAKKGAAPPLAPPKSPLATQLWYQTSQRPHYLALFLTGITCFGLLVWVLASHDPASSIGIGAILVPPSVVGFGLSLPLCVVYCQMSSSVIEPQGSFRDGKFVKNTGLDPFFAIRPMTTTGLVTARLITSFRSCLLASAVVEISSVALLLAPATEGHRSGLLGDLLLLHINTHAAILAALVIFTLPLVIWSIQLNLPLNQIFGERLGPILRFGAMFLAIFGLEQLYFHVSVKGDIPLAALPIFYFVFGLAAVALKLTGCGFAIFRLCRKRLISKDNAIRLVGIWVLAVAILAGAYALALPRDLIPLGDVWVAIAMILPANRILWKILLLDASRHQ